MKAPAGRITPLKILLLLLLLFVTTTITQAQEFGGNPPSIKWSQVNTPAAKVIFPAGLDSAALNIANIIQRMNGAIQPTIGFKQKQISIVLQNQTTIANAYVGLAPFRSEFYLTPEQNSFDIGSLPWHEQLAIHEFRHVQQYNNFDVGLSKVLRILFGEGGQALGNDLSVPDWFFEGDAVFNETHVSEQGRGRLPYFFDGYRALWAAGKDYSWMKLRNGSYRDFTPDWYPTGYMLVAYGREKYGDDFWKKVTHDAAAYKGGFYPLQRAIKKYSGEDFVTFRQNALHQFEYYFKNEPYLKTIDSLKKTDSTKSKDSHTLTFYDPIYPVPVKHKHQHFLSSQEYPAYVNDSTLIYMKSTYNHLPVFVIKTTDKEKNISVRDLTLDNYFAYHDGKIVYASYRPDVRWNYRNYSELKMLDIKTGDSRRITKSSKYFSPDFSADGKTIVAVQVGPSGKSELHLLNAADGKLINVVPNPDKLFFTYPKFYGDAQLISAVRSTKGQMSLALIDIKTGKPRYLLPFSFQPIGFINIKQDTVYFTGTSGIDNRLFALSVSSDRLYQLKNYGKVGSIGNYQPTVSDSKLAWVGLTAVGYQVNEVNKKDLQWAAISPALPGDLPDMGITALKRDSATALLDKVSDKPLAVTKYNKAYHLFNFHSLIPDISDPNYTLSLQGENVLNTFQSDISFTYNRDEGYKQFGFSAIYGALFPYINAGANYTVDRRGLYKGNNIYWNETSLHGGFEVPLNFSEGKHLTGLDFGSSLYYSQTNFQSSNPVHFNNSYYTYLSNYITFTNHIQQAKQNIYPRFGQSISLSYRSTISGLQAKQFLASGYLFVPGVLVNHNLVINAAHQQKGNDNVISFSNDFPFSRGYQAENLRNMNKIGASYALPIAYPDAGIANTIYFLRVRGNLFYDYTRASDTYSDGSKYKNFRSTGAEIYFDTKWFNQTSISFGFRYSYLADPDIFGGYGRNRFEFILPVAVF